MKRPKTARRALAFIDDQAEGTDEDSSEEDEMVTQADIDFIDDSSLGDYDLQNDDEYIALIAAARDRNRNRR